MLHYRLYLAIYQDIYNLDLDLQSQIGSRNVIREDLVWATTDYDPIQQNDLGTIKYILHLDDGVNVRSSEIIATYNLSTMNYSEYAINEVGSTITNATWSVVLSGGYIILRLTVTSGNYNIRISRELLN